MHALVKYNTYSTSIEQQLQQAAKFCPFRKQYKSRNEAKAKATAMYWNWFNNAAADCVKPRDNMLFQIHATIELLTNVLMGEQSLLLAGTGTGKTFMSMSLFDCLFMHGYLEYIMERDNLQVLPFPMFWITVSAAIRQAEEDRDKYKYLKGKVFIINYEQLRSKQSFASIMVQFLKLDEKRMLNDSEYARIVELYSKAVPRKSANGKKSRDEFDIYIPEWQEQIAPPIIWLDEIQKTRRNTAIQTRLIQMYFETVAKRRTTLVGGCSATPFVRPSESKTVCLMTRPPLDGTGLTSDYKVTPTNYTHFIREVICGPRIEPEEYSSVAMERLTNALNVRHNIVQVDDVKFKHKTINKHIVVPFSSPSDSVEYQNAFIEFLTRLAEAGRQGPQGMGEVFAIITAFRKKADWLKRYQLARLALQQVEEGYNTIIATPYVDTHQAVLDILVNELGYDKPICILKGGQSRDERWRNVNLFQDEEAHLAVNMLQAGGVALSLHQYKPRSKRPRWVIMGLVWGIIEMLQMLGRAHRINSDSTTHQWILSLAGTIEQDVSERLKQKAISARELLRKKENWSDLFVNEANKQFMRLDTGLARNDRILLTESTINENDDDNIDDNDDKDEGIWNMNEKAIADNLVEE